MASFDELHLSDREYQIMSDEAVRDRLDKLNDSVEEVTEAIEDFRDVYIKENTGRKTNVEVIDKKATNDAIMRVKEYNSSYIGDISLATDIYNAQQLGMKLRQLEIELKGGSVAFESGMFLDSSGDINIGKISINPKEIIRGTIRRLNEETFFRPVATGTGIVTLDSSFKFITLLKVPSETRIVLEKGLYLASIGKFEFKTTKNFNVGYALFSDKNLLQTDVRGKGIIALELPVHESELVKREVTPDNPYMVNGDYVLMWSGNLKRTVKPMSKMFGSLASGAGLVEEYTGTGTVFTAPTLGYYKSLAKEMKDTGFGEERTEALEEQAQQGKRDVPFLSKLFLRH